MILSRNFVKDYIDLDDSLTITQIAEDMTRIGNEYDEARKFIDCTNLIIGEVVEFGEESNQKKVVINPAVNFKRLEEVMIIKEITE